MATTDSKPSAKPESFAEAIVSVAAEAYGEDEFLGETIAKLCEAVGSEGCHLFSMDEAGGLILRASTVAPDFVHRCRIGRGLGLVGLAAQTKEPLFIPKNAQNHPKSVIYHGIDEREHESVAVLPLSGTPTPLPPSPSGAGGGGSAILGVAFLYKEKPWTFTKAEKARLTQYADTLAKAWQAFHNAYLLGASAKRMGALSEVAKTIAASPYLEEILQLLVNITAQRFGYIVCTVRLLDEARGELVLRATQAPAKAYQRKRALKLGESIAGKAIAQNRPIIVPDVQIEADYVGHDLAVEQGLRSMICVPLTIQDKVLGVMTCYTGTVREFDEDEISALEMLAKQAAISIEHAKLQVRNTLMQEMHHRVKNSLQQVASLLRLQIRHEAEAVETVEKVEKSNQTPPFNSSTFNSSTLPSDSLAQPLQDTLSRILAIAAVHDLLSREDLDHVSVRQVAEQLVSHQQSTLMLPDRKVSFEVRGDDFRLSMTQATQVALILNELIQNAVGHGFRQTAEGAVHVTVEERDGEIGIWVSNSGDSLRPDFDPAKHGSLGLQIVENLARGMGGKFVLEDRLGWTVAEVRFSKVGSE